MVAAVPHRVAFFSHVLGVAALPPRRCAGPWLRQGLPRATGKMDSPDWRRGRRGPHEGTVHDRFMAL